MTYRQYLAAIGLSVFSPMTRLLPGAALRAGGFSAWAAPLAALPLLLGLTAVFRRLITLEEGPGDLGEVLERRLGRLPGKLITCLLALWIVFYGGFLLRSGGERIISAVYPSASLGFFLPLLLGLSTVFALGRLRWAGRSALVTMLFFLGILATVFAMALPSVNAAYVWPPDLSRPGKLLRAAVPVADVLSPWVYFGFFRGRVCREERGLPRAFRGMLLLTALTVLFLFTVIGDMGPELAGRQQFPFFVMVKNLRLFDLMERFDALIVGLWMMTDYVFLGMLLLAASAAAQSLTGSARREGWVLPCAGGMLAVSFLISRNAFSLSGISEELVPAVNLGIAFVLLPLAALFPFRRKPSKK